MTLKSKLNLITAIVVSFSLVVIVLTVKSALKENRVLHQSQVLNLMSQKSSLPIHETQKERGVSVGYLVSKGKKFVNILPKQKKLTDNRNQELKAYLMYAKFITLVAQQNAYLDSFLVMATPKAKQLYKSTMNSPIVDKVNAIGDIALTKGSAGHFGVDSVVSTKNSKLQATTETAISTLSCDFDTLKNELKKFKI